MAANLCTSAVEDLVAGFAGYAEIRGKISVTASPPSRRATKRWRSSSAELAFPRHPHLPRHKSESVDHLSGTKGHPRLEQLRGIASSLQGQHVDGTHGG
jgi:hypothetical protein